MIPTSATTRLRLSFNAANVAMPFLPILMAVSRRLSVKRFRLTEVTSRYRVLLTADGDSLVS